jgi:hypothetical protein
MVPNKSQYRLAIIKRSYSFIKKKIYGSKIISVNNRPKIGDKNDNRAM